MDAEALRFATSRRSATLATIGPDGRPRLVPICFVLVVARPSVTVAAAPATEGGPAPSGEDLPVSLYSPLDEKPKRSPDVRRLARVRDILRRPDVTLLFDRWSEDWERLAWVRARGTASLVEPTGAGQPEHRAAVALLRERYPQYRAQHIERLPLIRVALTESSAWGDLAGAGGVPVS